MGMTNGAGKIHWPAVGIGLAVLAQLLALVWGAATINDGLVGARQSVQELKVVGKELTTSLYVLSNRVGVLEARVDALKEGIQDQRR